MGDIRDKNLVFNTDSVSDYLDDYVRALAKTAALVDREALGKAVDCIEQAARNGNTIYSGGNGGSAAIAEHLTCDMMKGTCNSGSPKISVTSLPSNMSVMTALANDFGYEHTLSTQLEMQAKPGDVLILISSSGNSPNIVRAIEKAREMGITVIGMSGFQGGKLAEMADISLYVPANNYGLAEDGHQLLMHVMAQYIYLRRKIAADKSRPMPRDEAAGINA